MSPEKLCNRPGSWAGFVAALLAVAGCSREPPPHTVIEFVENPRLLEATMLRCAENRAELKYTQNCLNARDAVDRIAVEEEAARRSQLDAQSERKREELRRDREAADDARARAEEAARQREEAEYLSQFDEPAPPETSTGENAGDGPGNPDVNSGSAGNGDAGGNDEAAGDEPPPAMRSSDVEPVAADEPTLQDVREELDRRQQAADPESAENQ